MLLKFAIKDFEDDREFRYVSHETIKSYMGVVNEFKKYCFDKNIIDVADVTDKAKREILQPTASSIVQYPSEIKDVLNKYGLIVNASTLKRWLSLISEEVIVQTHHRWNTSLKM